MAESLSPRACHEFELSSLAFIRKYVALEYPVVTTKRSILSRSERKAGSYCSATMQAIRPHQRRPQKLVFAEKPVQLFQHEFRGVPECGLRQDLLSVVEYSVFDDWVERVARTHDRAP